MVAAFIADLSNITTILAQCIDDENCISRQFFPVFVQDALKLVINISAHMSGKDSPADTVMFNQQFVASVTSDCSPPLFLQYTLSVAW